MSLRTLDKAYREIYETISRSKAVSSVSFGTTKKKPAIQAPVPDKEVKKKPNIFSLKSKKEEKPVVKKEEPSSERKFVRACCLPKPSNSTTSHSSLSSIKEEPKQRSILKNTSTTRGKTVRNCATQTDLPTSEIATQTDKFLTIRKKKAKRASFIPLFPVFVME